MTEAARLREANAGLEAELEECRMRETELLRFQDNWRSGRRNYSSLRNGPPVRGRPLSALRGMPNSTASDPKKLNGIDGKPKGCALWSNWRRRGVS